MIHRIPPGTRDVLPAELRELRRMQGALAAVFERFGYGEVATPTIEYDEVLARGEAERGAPVANTSRPRRRKVRKIGRCPSAASCGRRQVRR